MPTGLPTALIVHKSPSSAVNHNNAASNLDNLERPCVKMPIYARFPADRFESALLCTVLSGAANMSPELCDTLLFWTPLEQRYRLQNASHLLVFDLHRVPLPSCHAPSALIGHLSATTMELLSRFQNSFKHFGLLWMQNTGSYDQNLQEGKVKGKRLTGLFSSNH